MVSHSDASGSTATDAEIDAGTTQLVLNATDVIEIKAYAGGFHGECGDAVSDWVRADLAAKHVVRGSYRAVCTGGDAGMDAGPYGTGAMIGTEKTTEAEADISPAQVAALIAAAANMVVTSPQCICCDGEGFTATITRVGGSIGIYNTGLDYDVCGSAPIVSYLTDLFRDIRGLAR